MPIIYDFFVKVFFYFNLKKKDIMCYSILKHLVRNSEFTHKKTYVNIFFNSKLIECPHSIKIISLYEKGKKIHKLNVKNPAAH